MRKILAVLFTAATALAVAAPAAAITRGGSLDGNAHPYVGLMVAGTIDAETGDFDPGWRCSGALVSPTVYVTAGHCTEGAEHVELWFNSDLHDGVPGSKAGYGYPFEGQVSGSATSHPSYVDAAFWAYDLGVVVLDEPVVLDRYASIAPEGYVDGMAKGRNKTNASVTAVGYGIQQIIEGPTVFDFDPKYRADKTRYQATLMVVDTKGITGLGVINPGQSFTMSGDARHGGTCFGDSGGPILAAGTDMIVGVTSFGLNSNCAGIGGAYRVDRADDLGFLSTFGVAP